jgi:hypothetical protein
MSFYASINGVPAAPGELHAWLQARVGMGESESTAAIQELLHTDTSRFLLAGAQLTPPTQMG